ncbi:MAG: NAD(P)H-dependent oxidoreductase [Clostridiales bacterium]|nr:NAD(P)H-dependent oxidoreductase [Clostridiales bacterium]
MCSTTKILCISASNNFRPGIQETSSYRICKAILEEAKKLGKDIAGEIMELKNQKLNPCIDCIECFGTKRCAIDTVFNQIYVKIIACDFLFIVTPHYAPIPAKLCMLLEKMESITFEPWNRDNGYHSEVFGIPTAVISHDGGSDDDQARKEYKKIVNDPIANALATIQLKLVPFNDEWNTGISIRHIRVNEAGGLIFDEKISEYTRKVLNTEAL